MTPSLRRAARVPLAGLLAAALSTAGSLPPPEAPEDVVDAVAEATLSPLSQPDLLSDREQVALDDGQQDLELVDGTVTMQSPDGDLHVDLPTADGDAALIDDDGNLAVWDDDSHAVAVEALEDGATRAMFVLRDEDAPRRYSIDFDVPDGAELRAQDDGSVSVVMPGAGDPDDEDGVTDLVLAYVAAPWALDAAGTPVATSFTIEGTTLHQDVHPTEDTQYPVVADPLFAVPILIAIARTAIHVAVGATASAAARSVVRIVPGMSRTTSGGFNNMTAFKRAHGTRTNYEWHHIVEQGNVGRVVGGRMVTAREIHNPRNLVNIPAVIHRKCNQLRDG